MIHQPQIIIGYIETLTIFKTKSFFLTVVEKLGKKAAGGDNKWRLPRTLRLQDILWKESISSHK
jgi:hypothetical protein